MFDFSIRLHLSSKFYGIPIQTFVVYTTISNLRCVVFLQSLITLLVRFFLYNSLPIPFLLHGESALLNFFNSNF